MMQFSSLRKPRYGMQAARPKALLLLLLLLFLANHPSNAWKFRFIFPNNKDNDNNTHRHHDSSPETSMQPQGDDDNSRTKETSPPVVEKTATTLSSVPFETILPTPNIDVISSTVKVLLSSTKEVVKGVWSFLYENARQVVLYNPPVGLAYVLASIRLVRIFSHSRTNLNIQPKQFYKDQRRHGIQRRAFVLDKDDVEYDEFGGVEHVRRRLCQVAISSQKDPTIDTTGSDQSNTMVIQNALDVTIQPNESRIQFIYELIPHVARLMILDKSQPSSSKDSTGRTTTNISSSDKDIHNTIQTIAAVTCQVRLTDALLRLCRDRLLQTSYNLARTVEKFEQRTKISRNLAFLWQNVFRNSMEEDRLRLCIAQAAYESEIDRLGVITTILMQRPVQDHAASSSSSSSTSRALIDAVRSTEQRRRKASVHQASASSVHSSASEKATKIRTSTEQHSKSVNPFRAFSVQPWLSRYSFRWKLDGRGIVSIRKFDDIGSTIDSLGATKALEALESDQWTKSAKEWIQQSRRVLCQTVQGILQDTTDSSSARTGNSGDIDSEGETANFARLAKQWCRSNEAAEINHDEELYLRQIVDYVDRSASWERVGEGQRIRIRDILGIFEYGRRWDVWGIPSTLAILYVAGVINERFFRPYWPRIKVEMMELMKKAVEILDQRVWIPVKGIYDDFMNRSPSMMSALGLDAEETSLDHMLRDLGFGDGTPATRQSALQKATDQYERDISSGLLTNLMRGRLVQLLLVQVQQLKVGLLSALDTIDVLLQGNRINFQVLAAIPALLIATYGTRYFLRGVYNIRAKDIRPVTVVHGEMTRYLTNMENVFLLSDRVRVDEEDEDRDRKGEISLHWATRLRPAELGELILNMHRYLILLDFSSPPFRPRDCDEIQQSMQQFLGTHGTLKRLGNDRQLEWLGRVKQKHQNLVKAL